MIAAPLAIFAAACGDDDDGYEPTGATSPTPEVATLEVTSSAFAAGAEIPVKYTCDGDDVPFPLSWSGDPGETQSLALIFDDPDAPGDEPYEHWLMYDIPANMSGFESVSRDERLPNGAAQGENSRGEIGYAGPCPPNGQTHTYVMTVYALDAPLGLEPAASRDDLEAMEGHVLASGELTGTFGR
ncbi:MAG TPA: YbhB/YbcL family Raf kinase inhibitor-like protein [Dehalococcoidia bacterium]|nr:YbhB/YbcL family Raf kinase inhibitor-like protein [Dehalococcoidia bacterium]